MTRYQRHSSMSGTQVIYDGRKAVNLELLMGDVGWRAMGNDEPLAEDVRLYYEHVGLVYRCTHIRADSLSKVPWVITNDAGDTLWKKGEVPPANLLWLRNLPRLLHKTEAALTLGAQAYWHKERNRVRVTGLRWFAPLATAPWWDAKLGLTHFVRNIGVEVERIPPRDMVYVRYEYPLHETLRDRSPAEAALAAAGVLHNVDNFVADFFERGAIKATLLTVKGNPSPTERERLKSWWNRVFSGIKNAFKTDVISADAVTPVIVGEGIQELSNTELTGEKRNDVVITMGVPLSMVFSDAANYATAEQDEKNFYNSTIIPDCELIAEQVDEQLLVEQGLHLVFRPEGMDIFQADEQERAQSFATYVGAGLPASMTAEMLGLELPDGWQYDDLDEETGEPADESESATSPTPSAATPTEAEEPEEEDAAKAAEVQRVKATFRAWAKRRIDQGVAFDVKDFLSRHLTEADKTAILGELKGGGADQDFFTLPMGVITPDSYKAMLLQLDPEDDEAEQKIRLELERRFERELAAAFAEQLNNLLPDDAGDDAIRAAASQVEATSQPVREVLRRELERSSSLGVTVALDTLGQFGLGFDWTLAHTDAAKWASAYSYELVRGINATTAQRLQVAVNDWFQERTTLPDLVKELRPTFGRKRAKLIAQTETTRAATEGALAGWAQAGFTGRPSQTPPAHPGCRCWITIRINDDGSAEFIWQSARDERVCPICGDGPTGLHGKSLGFAKQADGPAPTPPPVAPRGPRPSGPPVSGALKLPGSGKYKPVYAEAVGAIDAVHGDGKLPEIPILTKSSMDANGQYRYVLQRGKGVAESITINGQGTHPQLTVVHEVGHFLDHQAISTPGKMASDHDPIMQQWRDAVDNSATVQRLKDKQRNPEKYVAEVEVAGDKFVAKPDRIFTSYLLRREELWARSYSQYIAQRSGNANMLAQLAGDRVDPIYGDRQWDDEDFAPIAAAIDALFRGLGWRL